MMGYAIQGALLISENLFLKLPLSLMLSVPSVKFVKHFSTKTGIKMLFKCCWNMHDNIGHMHLGEKNDVSVQTILTLFVLREWLPPHPTSRLPLFKVQIHSAVQCTNKPAQQVSYHSSKDRYTQPKHLQNNVQNKPALQVGYHCLKYIYILQYNALNKPAWQG